MNKTVQLNHMYQLVKEDAIGAAKRRRRKQRRTPSDQTVYEIEPRNSHRRDDMEYSSNGMIIHDYQCDNPGCLCKNKSEEIPNINKTHDT